MITILTPTYNRAYIIGKAYKSLVKQKSKDFEWLVIDDGSSDNTKEVINNFIKENKINIRYYYKKNGGKHTALNYGISKAKGELILVLDSDDILTSDAIKLVNKYWKKYESNKKICGMTFLRKIINPMYKTNIFNEQVSNMIEFKYNNKNLADMCEVIRTDIYKQYKYPEFENEKFLSEVILTLQISKKYDTAYIPVEIYETEYLEDGLSKNWLKNVVNSPNGARANSKEFMSSDFKFGTRLKNCIEYNVFSIIAKKPILKESKMKFWSVFFYIPSLFISIILKQKYIRRNKHD